MLVNTDTLCMGRGREGGGREREETCLVNLSNAIEAEALIFKNKMCLQK